MKYLLTIILFCFSWALPSPADELLDVKAVCREAGRIAMELREKGLEAADVQLPNGKIVRQTNADREASRYILDTLFETGYGIVSQDDLSESGEWYKRHRVWIVNPIDGTKAFERGSDDFHVQIALLEKDKIVLGVSYYPARDTYIWAQACQGAWIEKDGQTVQLKAMPSAEKVLVYSSSQDQLKPYFEKWGWTPERVDDSAQSSTSRLMLLIEGKASLYASLGALGPEKKGGVWNYGANALIAEEAGVSLTTLQGDPINFREPTGLLTDGILMTVDPELSR